MRRSNLLTRLGGRSREPGQAQRAARLMLVAILLLPQVALPATIIVNGNGSGITPGNGLCSLREAVNNANTNSDTSGGDCVAGDDGDSGGDIIQPDSNIELTIIDNTGTGYFGGINDARGIPRITSKITVDGGGFTISRAENVNGTEPPPFGLFRVMPEGTLTLLNTTVSNGNANFSYEYDGNTYYRGIGGGVWNNGGVTTMTNTTLSGNYARTGGGHCTDNFGTVTITDCEIEGNASRGAGGAIFFDATATVTNSTISENSALFVGGGIFSGYSSTTLTDTTISGNYALFGGGIFDYSDLTLNSSTVSGNTAGYYGGAIFSYYYGNVTLVNSTVSGNAGNITGGGTYATWGSTVTLTNSTVADNIGGGVYTGTFVYVPYPPGYSDLGNSVVARNYPDCLGDGGAPFDSGNNFSTDGSCPDGSTINPGDLGPLAPNGGPTETHALIAGSNAIEAAVNCGLLTDQRGEPRCYACDSGSYELLEDPKGGCDCILIGGPGKVTANEKFNLALSCANPDSRLLVAGGRNNEFSARFVPGCGVVQFGIGPRPNNFGTTTADGNGDATSSQTLGDSFGNSTIYYQVVNSSKCELSPVLPVFVNKENGEAFPETRSSQAAPGPAVSGISGQRLMSRQPNQTRMSLDERWIGNRLQSREGARGPSRNRPDRK